MSFSCVQRTANLREELTLLNVRARSNLVNAATCFLGQLSIALARILQAMAPFPLRCIICSKSHDYSDISHLLTHIASKSHLSNYFHAQVRSHQDAEVAQKLHTYDEWYKKNGLEKLLSQRMLQKESRQKGKATQGPKGSVRSQSAAPKQNKQVNGSSVQDINSVIDPNLFNLKSETSFHGAVPSSPGVRSTKRNYTAYFAEKHITSPTAVYESYPYPVVASHSCSRSIAGRTLSHSEVSYEEEEYFESSVGENVDEDPNYHGEIEKSDLSKLKGIIWPGMSLFDAASPEARRMRNQRKDGSVLAVMQASSELVEPTEVIYLPTWEIKKERFISGEVESSPPPAELPKKKKRTGKHSSSRIPLMEIDPNTLQTEGKTGPQRALRNQRKATPRYFKELELGGNQSSNILQRDTTSISTSGQGEGLSSLLPPKPSKNAAEHRIESSYDSMKHKTFASSQHQGHSGEYHVPPHLPFSRNQYPDQVLPNGLPGSWKTGRYFGYQDRMTNIAAGKENIASGFSEQRQQGQHSAPNFSWLNSRHLQMSHSWIHQPLRQASTSESLLPTDAVSCRANTNGPIANPLGRHNFRKRRQKEAWTLDPHYPWLSRDGPCFNKLIDTHVEASGEQDLRASSGDETIDQCISDDPDSPQS